MATIKATSTSGSDDRIFMRIVSDPFKFRLRNTRDGPGQRYYYHAANYASTRTGGGDARNLLAKAAPAILFHQIEAG